MEALTSKKKRTRKKKKSKGHFSENKSNDQESSNDEVTDTTVYNTLNDICGIKITPTDSDTRPCIQ